MPTQTSTHLDFFQQTFGTSVSSVIINGTVALILLYFFFKLVVIPVSELILDPLDFKRLVKRRTIFLELTPLAYSTKTSHATNQFIALLHNLASLRTRKEWLLRRKNIISFEVVSTRELGIRYVVQVTEPYAASFRQAVSAYLPEVRTQVIKDYLPSTLDGLLIELRPARHFAYPLAPQDKLDQHDPIAYLTTSTFPSKS